MSTAARDIRTQSTRNPTPLFENKNWLDWKTAAAISLVAVFQLIFSYRMRFCIYMVDDTDPLVSGLFFRSVYKTIFDNHLPVQVILSHWWVALFGASALTNRMMAATIDVLIEAQIFLIGRRINGYLTGVLAALLYFATEGNSWAYLNLSELPSALFALCAITVCLCFSRPDYRVGLIRPFWFGVSLSLSVLSRAMAVPMVGLIALLPLLHDGRKQVIKRNILPVSAGFIVPILVIAAYFASVGSLKSLIYWAFTYNFLGKSHPNPGAWIGDLQTPIIREIWMFNVGALLLAFAGLCFAIRSRSTGIVRALAICWLPAIGGWLGANPSGIGAMAFHAIPAFPFLCVALTSSLTLIWTTWTLGHRYTNVFRWSAVSLALASTYHFFSNTANLIYKPPVVPEYAHVAQIGPYIAAHTKPGSRIFVFGTNSLIYVTAHRDSATEFSILCGGLEGYHDRLLGDLQRAKPDTVIFQKGDAWYRWNLTQHPKVVAYILRNYRVSRRFPDVLFKPSPEATEPLLLSPDDLARAHIMAATSTWASAKDLLPAGEPQALSFAKENQWVETYIPRSVNFSSLGDTQKMLLELKVLVSGRPRSFEGHPLRILFLGRDGQKLDQFCSTWLPITPDSKVTTLYVPLTKLDLCHGDFSWAEVTGFQVGAFGPAEGNVAIKSFGLINPAGPESLKK